MSYIESLSQAIAQADWDRLFPEKKDKPPPGEFELGLVLGGTVSAGAYTAGVLDFLIEALDNWETEKERNPGIVPNWKVTLKAISGTSGGGVLAAIMAKALSWKFPHVSSKPTTLANSNPFYHVWVESLDIKQMLSNTDIKSGRNLESLLNSECRFVAGEYVANFPAVPLAQKTRHYVAEPLPIFLTLTNLRGIPYCVDWGNGCKQSYVNHADYSRLAIFTHGGNAKVREDEFGVSTNPLPGYLSWDLAAKFALGTSAFPIGLPLQPLSRPAEHYRYRPVVIPGNGKSPDEIVPLAVNWQALIPPGQTDVDPNYHFLAADGGVTDNEPVELCRTELAGMTGRNPRSGDEAVRAVILVDPFAEDTNLCSEIFTNLGDEAKSLFSSLLSQTRYDSQDLLLACHPDCYSRFMITARRDSIVGGKAIATACLGAFGGFLCQDYREHDYFLGRSNCKDFLENPDNLWFPETNPLFAAWRMANPTAANTMRRQDSKGRYSLPLIPLYGSAAQPKPFVPNYPTAKFNPQDAWFQELLEQRINALLDKMNHEMISSLIARLYVQLGEVFGKPMLIRKVTESISKGIADWGL